MCADALNLLLAQPEWQTVAAVAGLLTGIVAAGALSRVMTR